jgi:hypothetical protein
VVDLAQERDFGIGLEDEAKVILGQGKDIRSSKELKELRCVNNFRPRSLTDSLDLSERISSRTTSRKRQITVHHHILHSKNAIQSCIMSFLIAPDQLAGNRTR